MIIARRIFLLGVDSHTVDIEVAVWYALPSVWASLVILKRNTILLHKVHLPTSLQHLLLELVKVFLVIALVENVEVTGRYFVEVYLSIARCS